MFELFDSEVIISLDRGPDGILLFEPTLSTLRGRIPDGFGWIDLHRIYDPANSIDPHRPPLFALHRWAPLHDIAPARLLSREQAEAWQWQHPCAGVRKEHLESMACVRFFRGKERQLSAGKKDVEKVYAAIRNVLTLRGVGKAPPEKPAEITTWGQVGDVLDNVLRWCEQTEDSLSSARGAVPAAPTTPTPPTDGEEREGMVWLRGNAIRLTPALRKLFSYLLKSTSCLQTEVQRHFTMSGREHLQKRLCDLRKAIGAELRRSNIPWSVTINTGGGWVYVQLTDRPA